MRVIDTRLEEQIAELNYRVMDIAEAVSDSMMKELDYMLLLDALANHGYTIVRSTDQNIASLAYIQNLSETMEEQ